MRTSIRAVPADTALSDDEFEQLSGLLKKIGPSALNMEGVDGLFCALICSPEWVPPSEYLPHVWGEDAVFDSQDDVDRIVALLMRHWNTIARTLQGTLKVPDVYMPVLLVSDDGVTHGNDWAKGFIRGSDIRPQFWQELTRSDEYGGLLFPMLLLFHEHDPDPEMRPPPLTPEKREDILINMIGSLTKIYRHFEPLRRSLPSHPKTSPHLPRRTGSKIGRNNPCPCGSGKKFKHCCALDKPTVH
jgi:uncharacterized protein